MVFGIAGELLRAQFTVLIFWFNDFNGQNHKDKQSESGKFMQRVGVDKTGSTRYAQ